MNALLIPIKDPLRAKTRLADLLTGEGRRQLAWAMFEDVSRAATGATKPDRIVVVTSFAPAVGRARSLGWDVLAEEEQTSESASVDWASRVLGERGFDLVMRLPADVPLVRAEDIDDLMGIKLIAPAALLVPSRDGTGTNAIIRTPPALFPSRFGPDSLALHKEEAARAGVECVIVKSPRVALDIDDPSDLKLFLESGHGTLTFDALAGMNITHQLSAVSHQPSDPKLKTDS
ncbi:MAG: 2-phospho-L-lactate guanylyltransferase [Blastocatellia bacterium]|nr:2-phospho-L-lactate guanylyltransferase [Blastocatellia bacterium]